MAVIDIHMVHCVVNDRSMCPVASRSCCQGCFWASACCSGIMSASGIRLETVGDMGAMVRSCDMRHC